MKKIIIILVTILVIIFVVAIAGFVWWQNKPESASKYTGPVEEVKLSVYFGEFSGLIWIAENKGYFKNNGLDVKIKECQSGVEAMQDLLDGKADISAQAEFVAVTQSFKRNDFKILSSINSINAIDVIARRDSGIEQTSDLKGKKIGITRGSQAEFFLGTFLSFNSLKLSDVQIVNIKPAEIVDTIASGKIDATVVWQPLVYQIENKLGANGISWPGQSNQNFNFLLIGTDKLVKERPQVVERFLKAMLQAEQSIENDNEGARAIIGGRLKYEASYMEAVWHNYDFQVALNQKLLILMENEAGWAIKNKLTEKTKIPNYLDFIYFDALEEIKPEAVSIVH